MPQFSDWFGRMFPFGNKAGAAQSVQVTTEGAIPFVQQASADAVGSNKFQFVNSGAFTKQAVKAAPGTLLGILVTNNSAAAAFIQIFDALSASVTPGTTVPDIEFEVANAASLYIPFPDMGVNMATAITLFSSTAEAGATGTAAGLKAVVFFQ